MASPYFMYYSSRYIGNNNARLTLEIATESSANGYQIKITSPIYDYTYTFDIWGGVSSEVDIDLKASETVECSVKEIGYGYSDTITVTLADDTNYPKTKLPSYYPFVTQQWVWNRFNNSWYGQAGSCVANAFSTLKDIHEYIEGKGTYNRYSIGWTYGNRLSTHSQNEGMMYDEAFTQLKNDGIPYYKLLRENKTYRNNNYFYPDVYYYTNSTPTGVTAKQLVQNNYARVIDNARAQRISSYGSINVLDISSVKQHVINEGCVALVLNLYDNIYDATVTNTGIVPRYRSGAFVDGHMMIIMGWKQINGINYWICQNGWGSNAGDNGIYYYPFFCNFGTGYYYAIDGNYLMPKFTTPTLNVDATVKTPTSIEITINPLEFAETYYARINGGTTKSSSFGKFIFTNLTQNTQYYIEIWAGCKTFEDSDKAGYYATTLIGITPWTWTTSELSAFNNKGLVTTITYQRWNEFVDKIYEVSNNDWWTSSNDGATLSYSATKMTSTDKTLTADRFNSVRYNIGARKSTGIARAYKDDHVYGSYFITLGNKLNEWIQSIVSQQ